MSARLPTASCIKTHDGPTFSVEVIKYTDEAGKTIRKDVVRHPGAVTVIPIRDDGRIILIRNNRISIDRMLLEFPAGGIDPGETPDQAAARELIEETGYSAMTWTFLGSFYTSPGLTDECMHAFLAEDLQEASQSLQPGEEIEVVPVTRAELDAMIASRTITDGKTLSASLLWRTAHDPKTKRTND